MVENKDKTEVIVESIDRDALKEILDTKGLEYPKNAKTDYLEKLVKEIN